VRGPAALLDHRCARRLWRIRSGRRNDRFPIEQQRNRGSHRGSGWHSDSRIERLACLQHTETYNQKLAHCRYNDLFGLEAARFLEARDKSCDGGIHDRGWTQQGSASDHLVRGISGLPRPWIPYGMNSGARRSRAISTAQVLRPKGRMRLTAFLAARQDIVTRRTSCNVQGTPITGRAE
jgi:hypothetical protein